MEELQVQDLVNEHLVEYYNDPDELALYQEYQEMEKYGRFFYLFKSCVGPTTFQTVELVGPLIAMCVILRIVSLLKLPRLIVHFVSFVCGIAALFLFVKKNALYPLTLCCLSYPVLFVRNGKRGIVMACTSVAFLITCELFIVTAENWHQVRGSQMVLVMKLISLAFDVDKGVITRPNILEYFGYTLSVSSVVFGPFMTYTDYCQILVGKPLSFSWLVGVIRSSVISYSCLIISACISPWIFEEDAFKWFVAYQSAMSFRFSHYFVSFLSECTSLLSGIGTEVNQEGKQLTIWRSDVARPQHIELPRSLVEVVVHWNIPMHVFLKNYVFKKAQPLGRFTAVFLTFALSSLLHGINFQLAAVLISIGTYAYIEHVFRLKVGKIFSACILARKCRPECGHVYKEGNFWVTAANLGFSFLSMFHLAYLGIMFGGDTEVQEKVTYCLILWNIILDGLNYPPLPAQQVWLNTNLGQPILFNSLRVEGCILIIFNEEVTSHRSLHGFTLRPDKRLALEMSSSLSPVPTVANLINTVDTMYHCMGFGLIMIFKCS